jgi:hypothetical protein
LRDKRDEERRRRIERAEQGNPEPAVPDEDVLLRVRATRTKDGAPAIDLTKAEADCVHCGGSGRRGVQVVKSEDTGETLHIPVVCRCVKRNGGVAKDLLDRLSGAVKNRSRWDERRRRRRARANKAKRKKKKIRRR